VYCRKAPMLSEMRPPANRLAPAKMGLSFFWKSAYGSSLLLVFFTSERLTRAIIASGIAGRVPIV